MNSHERRSIAITLLLLPAVLTGCVAPQTTHDPLLTARLDEILNRLADTGAVVTARKPGSEACSLRTSRHSKTGMPAEIIVAN